MQHARDWSDRFARRTQHMTRSAVRELLHVAEQPDVISFAGGLPAPEAFPIGVVAEAAQRVLHDQGPRALQYGATEGYLPLRAWIADTLHTAGVPVSAEHVLITTGSQQALDLLGKVFIDPGDGIVVESPTYLAALQAWNAYGAAYLEVPADADGMCTDALESLLRRHQPKLVYCLPNFQNPSGVTLTRARREQLVALAGEAGVVVVEDDPYRDLRFEGEELPRLIELASASARPAVDMHDYDGQLIYVSTFSKVISPGLRVGSVVAPLAVIRKLTQAKQGADLHTAMLNQMLVYELVSSGLLQRHVATIVDMYRERRDTMLDALAQTFPAGVHWTHPAGGLFLWVTLPEEIDAADLLRAAVRAGVAFVPGAPFHPSGSSGTGANTFRLNFSNASPAQIRDGIARLGALLHAALDEHDASPASTVPRVPTGAR
jgi:2-aminoadipate transaminase